MKRQITASYDGRRQAERVRERLEWLGVDPADISIVDDRPEAQGPGIFDKLAELIAPTAAASRPSWRLTAEVAPEQLDAASGALRASERWEEPQGKLEARTFVFRETRERLVVDKEVIVREEIVLARQADVQVEEVHGTVRRMAADVERLAPASAGQIGSIPK